MVVAGRGAGLRSHGPRRSTRRLYRYLPGLGGSDGLDFTLLPRLPCLPLGAVLHHIGPPSAILLSGPRRPLLGPCRRCASGIVDAVCSAISGKTWRADCLTFWRKQGPMKESILQFEARAHRTQVVALWQRVFGYGTAHNAPHFAIDKKLAAGDGLFFVAEAGGKVVGSVMAGYDGHRGWIYSLAVLPEYRGRGLGSRLMRHAEERLKRLGCPKINLQIMQENEGVQAFYRKLGYQTEQRISMGKKILENITLAEPGAAPDGGPATPVSNSSGSGGPPSVS
jgi:ribosomal protein S18 acetylase RimI-like enzyme